MYEKKKTAMETMIKTLIKNNIPNLPDASILIFAIDKRLNEKKVTKKRCGFHRIKSKFKEGNINV